MSKYKKKPVVVEAVKFTGDIHQPELMTLIARQDRMVIDEGDSLIIETLKGNMTARTGDYIILDEKNKLYPRKPDIFEQIYEKVE